MQTTLSRRLLSDVTHKLSTGDTLDPGAFARSLIDMGYKRVRLVEESGDFSVRGGIVDLLPFGYDDPLRLELDGDRIESIRQFDVYNAALDPRTGRGVRAAATRGRPPRRGKRRDRPASEGIAPAATPRT